MENLTLQKHQSDKLIFLGITLFLFGLIVGLFVPMFANPRMGLSSHIEGVLNGIFLIVLGLIWNKIDLSVRWLKINFWLAVYGTFANWFGILVAAIFNAGKLLNIASQGKEGSPLAEAFVNFSLISLSIAMIILCIITLVGLKGKFKQLESN
ncbi:MAG: hydrogenase [Ignavibacteriales bacterium]